MSQTPEETSQTPPPLLDEVEGRNTIDYMLRTTKQHITAMLHLADNKASIVTGITMVMLTVVFGFIQSNGMTISLAVLGLSVFCAAMIALTAAMPSRHSGKPGTLKMSDSQFNPLFFSHAIRLSEEEFVEEMAEILYSDAKVYRTILRDLHQVSQVAERKFRKVRLAYSVLFAGLLATTATVIWEQWDRIVVLFS